MRQYVGILLSLTIVTRIIYHRRLFPNRDRRSHRPLCSIWRIDIGGKSRGSRHFAEV